MHMHKQMHQKKHNHISSLLNDIRTSISLPSPFCEFLFMDVLSILNHFSIFINQYDLLSRKNHNTRSL